MPRIKRWFPVSQDFNDDGELWDFTDKFGDRSIRLWFEICNILDKTENRWEITKKSFEAIFRKARIKPGNGWLAVSWLFTSRWLAVYQPVTNQQSTICGSPNYWKYHKGAEPDEFLLSSLLPSFLPDSSLKKEKNQKPATPEPSVDSLKATDSESDRFRLRPAPAVKQPWQIDPAVKAAADKIYAIDRKRYAKLVVWITAASQHVKPEVIVATLEGFLPYAREPNISWWSYLDKILDKTEAKTNARSSEIESERFKRQDKETAAALFAGAGMGQKTQ